MTLTIFQIKIGPQSLVSSVVLYTYFCVILEDHQI